MLAETGLKPVIADVFLNMNLYKNRLLTHKECVDPLVKEIKQAHRLGIHLIRLVSMVPYWVIEPLLPYCKEYDVTIALEVHAATAFDIPETRAFIEEMKRVNSPYVGLVIDTGIFCRKFPRVVRAYETLNGTSEQVFDYIDTLFEKGTDLHRVLRENNFQYPAELEKAIQSEHDRMLVPLCDGYENLDFSVLDEYMPYIKHFHFKLFEMTEDGEYSMDYLGKGLAMIACVVNPEAFVIGGGMARAGEILMGSVRRNFKQKAFHASRETEFKEAKLGNNAGIYGGVRMLLE